MGGRGEGGGGGGGERETRREGGRERVKDRRVRERNACREQGKEGGREHGWRRERVKFAIQVLTHGSKETVSFCFV